MSTHCKHSVEIGRIIARAVGKDIGLLEAAEQAQRQIDAIKEEARKAGLLEAAWLCSHLADNSAVGAADTLRQIAWPAKPAHRRYKRNPFEFHEI